MDTNESIEWRKVVGYEGLYEVSSDGHVKRVGADRMGRTTSVGLVMRATLIPCGYLSVMLYLSNGYSKRHYVHRIVASAFLGELIGRLEVNHINGIKTDNRVSNLEIVTRSQNLAHAINVLGWKPTGASGEKNVKHKLTSDEVLRIRSEYHEMMSSREGKVRPRRGWSTVQAERYGVTVVTIGNVINGRSWALEEYGHDERTKP